MNCVSCKWRKPVGEDMPEANAANFRCTRFPRHEIYALERMFSHSCGEWQPMELDQLIRFMLGHSH